MENKIELTSIFIANGMALLLAVQLLFCNNWRFAKNNKEYKFLRFYIWMSGLACIIDPIVFLSDGHQGRLYWMIVYIGNMILFVEDILVGIGWITLVCRHLLGRLPAFQKVLITVLSTVGMLAVVANLFIPIVYYVDENSVYHRKLLFWLFTFIEGVFLIDGVFTYIFSKMKGGIFKFFPVLQFIFPIVAGIVVQGMFYGVSLVYPTVMISFAGLLYSLKNEALFTDSLTGLYNRSFMDELSDEITKKGPSFSITALMLDLDGFKSINDQYGHAEGDVALKKVASILKSTVGALGCVIRYAGDEFVILLNTKQDEIVDGCIRSIHRRLQEENETSGKKYKLSMSVGYCYLSEHTPTLDDILTEADRAMYKKKYYSNPQSNRTDRL